MSAEDVVADTSVTPHCTETERGRGGKGPGINKILQ